MDTSATTAHPMALPQLEQNGKRLPCSLQDPLDHQAPAVKARPIANANGILHRRSHSRNHSDSSMGDSHEHHNHATHNGEEGQGGLSLREQQQQRNQQACINSHNNSNSSTNGSPASLTLSITPPKITSSYLNCDPSSSQYNYNHNHNRHESTEHYHHHHGDQNKCLPENGVGNNSGSNNSLLRASHDSLGSSLNNHGGKSANGADSRRASFSLSTSSLNFNPGSSTSMASPSSPSYSTIAVARARAAAAAAGATSGAGGGRNEGQEQGMTGGQEDIEGGFVGSGDFPGGSTGAASISFSPSGSSPSIPASDGCFSSTHPNQPHPHLSQSLTSSSSSLLSNDSLPDGLRGPSSSSSSKSAGGLGSSQQQQQGLQPTHLQDNTNAERQISMILEDFLFVGGELVEEEQIEELERLGIKRVLNMAANCDDELWIERIGGEENTAAYLKVGLLDHVDQDLKEGLDKAVEFIASSKDPVYVHCQAGKSRSVATVIGYLIQEHRWPLKKAYDHVVERRRIMSPNIGFVSQLIMLEERVLGKDKAGGLVGTAK
ncbi:hypothetical protein EDD11_005314 [Mortierella claussenii]|nr:hypothetical protein EDD11_005314 [Mortierella claussenii]